MLSVKNLNLKYTKEFYALEDVSLEIDDGESVAFVGEAESGKTTLLRVLAKLEDFDSVHLPSLKFNDRVKGVIIDNPYFTLDLLVTDGRFELYDYRPGKHGENDQAILYDDLSMEWQTYTTQILNGKGGL